MATTFRTTQAYALVATRSTGPGLRATQAYGQVAAAEAASHGLRATQAYAEVAIQVGALSPAFRITQMFALAATHVTPDFRWRNMVQKIRFPTEVSDGSEVVGRFNTDRGQVESGFRQAVSRWTEGLKRFDVAKGVDTMQQMIRLDAFHRIVKGAGNPFLFRDPTDYTSAGFTGQDVTAIANDDQIIGVGNASTTHFQLKKTYHFDDGEHPIASTTRTITHPIGSTVVVAAGASAVTAWTVNTSTGCVAFNSQASVKATDISFESSAGRELILSVSTDFSVFVVGHALQVSGSTVNATAGNHVWIAASVTSTLIRLTTSAAAGSVVTEAAGGTVTVNVHPAPRTGQVLTAGYWFDIPAAFETDELPLRLSQYNIGEATVLVEEVRVETSC